MVAGIDIGGSVIKACLVEGEYLVASTSLSTDLDSAHGLDGLALAALGALLTDQGLALSDLTAIGVGIPGQVHDGVVRNAANLGIGETGMDLGGLLSSATQVPILVENDMSAAAYGAYNRLARTDPALANLVYVGLGTGVAAGIVLRGEVYSGSRRLAGEIGHVPMGTDLVCVCGSTGCLETVVGAAALQRSWRGDDAGALFLSAAEGDRRAGEIAGRAIELLAQALWWLAAAYDPDVVLIGGGVGTSTPVITAMLAERWVEMARPSPLATRVLDPDRVRLYDLGEPVGAYGAALLAAVGRGRSRKREESDWEEVPIP